MALERTNPLPVGGYTKELVGQNAIDVFQAWKSANLANVKVRSTQGHNRGDPDLPFVLWVAFDVTGPTAQWPSTKIGFPDRVIDAAKAQSPEWSSDTYKTPIDNLTDASEALGSPAGLLTMAGIAVGGLALVWYLSRR